MAGELLVHARGRAIRSTVHRLDERQERYSFERRTILATRADHLDRGEGAGGGVGLVGLLASDPRFVEHLQHDVDVGLLAA